MGVVGRLETANEAKTSAVAAKRNQTQMAAVLRAERTTPGQEPDTELCAVMTADGDYQVWLRTADKFKRALSHLAKGNLYGK